MIRNLMCCAVMMLVPMLPTATLADDGDVEVVKGFWQTDVMMSQACDGVSQRYKLDEQQKEATCQMITDGVSQFLEKHDKQLWPLMAEMLPLQFAGKQPDAETAKRMGQLGGGIFEDARRRILEAQGEFHKLLDDDQKAIHDRDMRGLKMQLQRIERTITQWKSGDTSRGNPLNQLGLPGDQRLVPRRNKPRSGKLQMYESQWERYVRNFIQQYGLDASQKNRANAILEDLKVQAAQYTRQNKQSVAEAERTLADVRALRPVDMKKILQAEQLRDLLYAPFDDWFVELQDRVGQIPTEKQRQDHASAQSGGGRRERTAAAPRKESRKQNDASSKN